MRDVMARDRGTFLKEITSDYSGPSRRGGCTRWEKCAHDYLCAITHTVHKVVQARA